MRRAIQLSLATMLSGSAAFADGAYSLAADYAGMREYYCQTRGSLTNTGSDVLQELNGFFYVYLDGEQVGRSRGNSFLNVAPGETVEALFDAPNTPCDQEVSYHFVVGACRFDDAFQNQSECAAMITGSPVITEISAP